MNGSREAVLEGGQFRTLAILQIQNMGNQHGIRRNRLSFLAFLGACALNASPKAVVGTMPVASTTRATLSETMAEPVSTSSAITTQPAGAVFPDVGNRPADKNDAVLLESL